jgi:hypothetical protein
MTTSLPTYQYSVVELSLLKDQEVYNRRYREPFEYGAIFILCKTRKSFDKAMDQPLGETCIILNHLPISHIS